MVKNGRKARQRPLSGAIHVPSDKSISHRAVMLASVANGTSRVQTSTLGRDNLATLRIMRQLGVTIDGCLNKQVWELAQDEGIDGFTLSTGSSCELRIIGSGFDGLNQPKEVLDCGNSGTTSRLLCGLLSGRPFAAEFTGDHSLKQRPFKRVTEPLSKMGATFSAEHLPFTLSGGTLRGITYKSPRASAQVKSAILLAGLQTEKAVVISEPRQSRDHTERMLRSMGCSLEEGAGEEGRWEVRLPGRDSVGDLHPLETSVPGDVSSAAFFMVAASLVQGSCIKLCDIGFNPTRNGIYPILERMGAKFVLDKRRIIGGEEVVDLEIRSADFLRGVDIDAHDVVLAIDEIPIIAIAAALAEGKTSIRGAAELRVKESDRLAMVHSLLKSFSLEVEEFEDGLVIQGKPELRQMLDVGEVSMPKKESPWRMSGDHRILMSGAVLEYALCGEFGPLNMPVVETSYPGFVESFQSLSR